MNINIYVYNKRWNVFVNLLGRQRKKLPLATRQQSNK